MVIFTFISNYLLFILYFLYYRYSELPRKYIYHFPDITITTNRKQTLSQYFFSQNCILCNNLSQQGFCKQCEKNPQYLITQLNNLLSKWTKKQHDLKMVKIKLYILFD